MSCAPINASSSFTHDIKPAGFVAVETGDSVASSFLCQAQHNDDDDDDDVNTHTHVRENKLEETHRFGKIVELGERVSMLIKSPPKSEIAELFESRKESVYASRRFKPLGRTAELRYAMPANTLQNNFSFGAASISSEDVKQVIYPDNSHTLVRSASFEREKTSEQTDINGLPASHRYGHTPTARSSASSTSSLLYEHEPLQIGMRKRENFNAHHKHCVGHRKSIAVNLRQLPPDYTFGHTNKNNECNAQDCLSNFSHEQSEKTKSVNNSKHSNIISLRNSSIAAGSPSIHRHKKIPQLRSICDMINYGDDATAIELLYPPRFSFVGIEQNEFCDERPLLELRTLFASAGYVCDDKQFAHIKHIIDTRYERKASILSFRTAFNSLSDAHC